jgi:hypothetical protein
VWGMLLLVVALVPGCSDDGRRCDGARCGALDAASLADGGAEAPHDRDMTHNSDASSVQEARQADRDSAGDLALDSRDAHDVLSLPDATADVIAADVIASDLVASDLSVDQTPDLGWAGQFEDDFDRVELAAEQNGWRLPLSTDPTLNWSIDEQWLRVSGDLGLPGSAALRVDATAEDLHLEVTIHRTDLSEPHFTDVIVRMDPALLNQSFYRVRIYQEHVGVPGKPDDPDDPDYGNGGLQIAIFKITPDMGNEHGIVINDAAYPPEKGMTYCTSCPWADSVASDIHLRVIVDLVGATFAVKIVKAGDPSQLILQSNAVDTTSNPLMGPGYVGLAHYSGVAQFDDFVLRYR